MKKILGIILSITFITFFFWILIKISSFIELFIGVGATVLVLLFVMLCTWLLISD
jgi:hypothetical protein